MPAQNDPFRDIFTALRTKAFNFGCLLLTMHVSIFHPHPHHSVQFSLKEFKGQRVTMTELLYKYEQLYQENKAFIESAEVLRYPQELFDELSSQLMLSWNKPNPSHCAEITAMKVNKYPSLKINERQKDMLLTLSNDLNLDEIECFELAIDLSTAGVKESLEDQLDSATLDFPSALRELFFFRKMRIVMILFDLMKARSDLKLKGKKRDTIMRLTNKLFRDGLARSIMTLISDQMQRIRDPSKPTSRFFMEKIVEYMQRLSECLFYMFYSTQINRDEADQMLELVRVLSNGLIPTLYEKETVANGSRMNDPVDISLFPTLVILQLTHVRAMNQVVVFYNREVDSFPFGDNKQGNSLLGENDSEWDYGKQLLTKKAPMLWENRMVRGFTCLSLGVIREPLVEAMAMHPSEPTMFFDKAYECNAYSYIRLCLVPTIQYYDEMNNVFSSDFRDLLFSTLVGDTSSGLLVDIMNCFVNEAYHMEFPFNEWGRQRELERRKYDLDNEIYESGESPERVIFTAFPDENPPISCDCVDDILDMFTVTLSAQPSFANKLWHSNGTKHPFITALLDIIDKNFFELKYAALKFFTAIANSQQSNFAFNIYVLLNNAKTQFAEILDWKDMFCILENSSMDLQQVAAIQVGNNPPPPPDEYFLEDCINLLGSVMRDPRVLIEFVENRYDPIKKLFNLLVCQISVSLKGAIFKALAALCCSLSPHKVSGDTSAISQLDILEQVWLYLEDYQILPSATVGSGRGVDGLNYGGLQYELEHVESGTLGQYPVTIGFLSLLVALLDHEGSSIPHNLGYGQRLPGILSYIDFVIGEVLLKLESRRYLPNNFSGEGQKWKIATLSVRILTLTVQKYNINSLTAADIENFEQPKVGDSLAATSSSIFESPQEEIHSMVSDFQHITLSYPLISKESPVRPQQVPATNQHQQVALVNAPTSKRVNRKEMRPKSAGFAVMSYLLDQNRELLLFLLQILHENCPRNINSIRRQEMLHIASLAVQDCVENSEISMFRTREEISSKCREAHLQYQYQHQRSYQQRQQISEQPHVAIFFSNVLQGTEIGWNDMFYDNSHWRLQAAVAVLGLLYEVSIREGAYLDRMRSSGPLTMLRNAGLLSRNATSALVDIQVTPLSTSLITDLQSFQSMRQQMGYLDIESDVPLSYVLAYLSFLPEKSCVRCTPSVEILSLRILKHVSKNQTNKKVLNSIKDMGVNAQKIIENCSYFLEDCSVMLEKDQSTLVVRHSGSINEVLEIQHFSQSDVSSVRPPIDENYDVQPEYCCKREAVLELLLSTLRPAHECLCHYLLFGIHGIRENSDDSTTCCLNVLLDLVGMEGGELDRHHISIVHPFQAVLCFELLYRLYASPLTADAIKSVVRKRKNDQSTGHFMVSFLHFFLEYHRRRIIESGGAREKGEYSLEDSARLNCCAWALKIVALEFSIHSHANDSENIQQVLKSLFDPRFEAAEDKGATTSDTTSNLLLQLLMLVPISLEFTFGYQNRDESEAIVVQCMRESSKRYNVSKGIPYQHSGKHLNFNEPPGDFMFVDIPHFVLLLKTYFVYTNNGKKQNIDEATRVKINDAVQVALQYNTFIGTMASTVNFCHAFRQIVEMALFKYSTALLGNYQLNSRDDDYSRQELLEGSNHEYRILERAESASDKLVSYLINPCLVLLAQNPGMEMLHAEQLSKSLVAMFDALRDITVEAKSVLEKSSPSHARAPPVLTAACYSNLLSKVVIAILRRGNVGSPRNPSTALYRGNFYVVLFVLLQCASDLTFGSSAGRPVEDFQSVCRDVLQSSVIELLDAIGEDITNGVQSAAVEGGEIEGGLQTCASNAFSALVGILNVLGPSACNNDDDDATCSNHLNSQTYSSHGYLFHASPGYLHGLNTLLDRGYLVRIFSAVSLVNAPTKARSGSNGNKRSRPHHLLNINLHTLESVLSLCAHLACSREGANILLDLGVYSALNALPQIPLPSNKQPSSVSSSMEEEAFSIDTAHDILKVHSSSKSNWMSNEDIDALMSLHLLIFKSSLSSACCSEILEQCALFLSRNQSLVAHYVRLQSTTLEGLRICDALVSLFCMICCGPPVCSPSGSRTSLPSWESRMGATGDSITNEMCKLLVALGGNPLPSGVYSVQSDLGFSSVHQKSWWSAVRPSNQREASLHQKSAETPTCLHGLNSYQSSFCQWSCFDVDKLQLGLRISERCSSFFRIRSGEWVKLAATMSRPHDSVNAAEESAEVFDNLGLGLLKFDMVALSFTFQSLCNLYLQMSDSSATKQSWLKTPQVYENSSSEGASNSLDESIRGNVLRSVESLLCAIFDISKASVANARLHGRYAPKTDAFVEVEIELQKCVKLTNRFPGHSFVHQIGRSLLSDRLH